MLGSNAFLKLEYRYTNYKDWEITFSNGGKDSFGFERHQAVLGVGLRF